MQIHYVDVYNFRRLRAIRLNLHAETTILVGANNSGKTAAVHALDFFLRARDGSPSFALADIHTAGWGVLDELGETWRTRTDAPDGQEAAAVAALWAVDLAKLQRVLPALDLYLAVEASELHLVSHLIPSLDWEPPTLLRIRAQLELAQDVDELQELATGWCEAWRRAHGTATPNKAWPRSFSDYLSRELTQARGGARAKHGLKPRISLYKVDAPAPGTAPAFNPILTAKPLGSSALVNLLRVDIISAQRGLGGEEHAAGSLAVDGRMSKGVFTQHLLRHCAKQFKLPLAMDGARAELDRYAAEAEEELNLRIHKALDGALQRIRKLGYPHLRDPEIELHSRIRTEDLLNHESGVRYRGGNAGEVALPEHAIGLGYQNLLLLSFQLVLLRETRESALELDGNIVPRIHLVIIEEPEAHLHAQVQRAFVERARDLLVKDDDADAGLTAQLVVTSHSSHIAHAVPFSQLRYFRRVEPPTVTQGEHGHTAVVDLSSVWGEGEPTRRFVERYLQLQHSDLFFAEAAILVEGTAERVLLPFFIEAHEAPTGGATLGERYIALLPVGGAHAHRFKPLIEAIGLTTLIITDLDPLFPEDATKEEKDLSAKAWVMLHRGQKSSNATLKDWLPARDDIDTLVSLAADLKSVPLAEWTDGRARVAYQVPSTAAGHCASTFEDALILENTDWFGARDAGQSCEAATGALRKTAKLVRATPQVDLPIKVLDALSAKRLGKGELAIDVLLSAEEHAVPKLRVPKYLAEGFDWLSIQLGEGHPVNTNPADPPVTAEAPPQEGK